MPASNKRWINVLDNPIAPIGPDFVLTPECHNVRYLAYAFHDVGGYARPNTAPELTQDRSETLISVVAAWKASA